MHGIFRGGLTRVVGAGALLRGRLRLRASVGAFELDADVTAEHVAEPLFELLDERTIGEVFVRRRDREPHETILDGDERCLLRDLSDRTAQLRAVDECGPIVRRRF